jgi:hypothetical protein
MRGQRFAVEIPGMPVMVEVGPGRGRGYVSIIDGPGSLVAGTPRRPSAALRNSAEPSLAGRGARFAPDTRVGAPLPSDKFHTIPDREAAWQMVVKAMNDLQADLATAGVKDSKNTVWRLFFDAPTIGAGARLLQWQAFHDEQEAGRKNNYTGDGTANITNADAQPWALQYTRAAMGDGTWGRALDAYGNWLTIVADLRKMAAAAGVPLHSSPPPTPADLPSTLKVTEIPGAIIDKAKGAIDKLGDLGKYALIGAGVLAGTLVVIEVAKH